MHTDRHIGFNSRGKGVYLPPVYPTPQYTLTLQKDLKDTLLLERTWYQGYTSPGQTNTYKNITFPQLHYRSVMNGWMLYNQIHLALGWNWISTPLQEP